MSDDAERLGRLERERANVIERMQRAEAEAARLRAELDAAQAQARVAHASQAVAWSYYRRTRSQRDRGHTLRGRAQRLATRVAELEAALTELYDVLIDTAFRTDGRYDWNADPDRMTLRQGRAWDRATALLGTGKELPRE